MDVSGNPWILLKDVRIHFVNDLERGVAMQLVQGKSTSSWVDLGYTRYFAFLRWHQCSSHFVTVFLGILWSSIKEIEVPYEFDWEHGIPLDSMHEIRASSWGDGEDSLVFSSCGRHMGYILELRREWSFETRVLSVKSGLLSSYDGHLRNLI